MSQLNVNQIVDASGGVLTPVSSVMRNRIINGAMVIDQRNAGASVATSSGSSVFTVDRWVAGYTQTSKFTVQQNAGSVTPPEGFTNYLGATSSSAYSVLTGDAFWLHQRIEGLNVADLGFGTANAKTITISFWVRSSLTGTFGGSVFNSAANRSYPFTYTITSSNTWEQKSITIAGDTSGTWLTTNGSGLQLNFSLGTGTTFSGTAGAWAGSAFYSATGATSVVGTNGATFYITGVQLEVGTQATGFEYRQYGQELALCQRYYYKNKATSINGRSYGSGVNRNTTTAELAIGFPVEMRTSPTALEQTGTAGNYGIINASSFVCSSVPTFVSADTNQACVLFTSSAMTAGQGALGYSITSTSFLAWSAEL